MFGFVTTEEKQKFIDNNDLLEVKNRRERHFNIMFIITALIVLNFALYFITKSN